MPEISVKLPSLLAQAAGGTRRISVTGDTLREALDDLKRRYPTVAIHLFDETGEFRRHVLCFLNDTSFRGLDSLDHPVADGDTIFVLQAVSGGRQQAGPPA